MEKNEKNIVERLEAATALLEGRSSWLEERQGLSRRGGEDLGDRRAEQARGRADREAGGCGAGTGGGEGGVSADVLNPLRRTMPAATAEMLAKHGIGEGPVDVRTLDAALSGLSLEQRIAVKSQLLRAGAIA